MSSILDFLKTDTGKTLISGAAKKVGATEEKTGSVLSMALPMIMGMMKKNAEGSEDGLNKALESAEHDGSILNNLSGIFGEGAGSPDGLLSKGSKILGHITGGSSGPANAISGTIAKTLGMDASQVTKIIEMAMPVVMGLLGKQKREAGVESSGLASMLGSVMGKSGEHDSSLLNTFLDADGEGNISDDLGGILGDKKEKQSKSDLLGGIFGK
jgi:hypothetical protein